jgi:phosphatidylserine/phosphatidylglycerophosphate/cardiolipin synthase-like enzyme
MIRPHVDLNDYPGSDIPYVQDYVAWLFRKNDLRLIQKGARVFEFTRAMTHLKVALIDNWFATHGSYNLNYRSAKKDLEIVLFIESKSYARQMREKIFDIDLEPDGNNVQEIEESLAREYGSEPGVAGFNNIVEAILRQIG